MCVRHCQRRFYSLSRLSIDSFSWSYIRPIYSCLLIAVLYISSFLFYTLFVQSVKADVQFRMHMLFQSAIMEERILYIVGRQVIGL